MGEGVVNSGFMVSDSNLKARRMLARTESTHADHEKKRGETGVFRNYRALHNELEDGFVYTASYLLGLVCVYGASTGCMGIEVAA
jgi:hypothetical protein